MADASSFIGVIFGAAVTAVGWWVVWITTKNREARKSLRTHLEGMSERVDALLEDAIKYHTEPRSQSLEIKVLWQIERLVIDQQCCNTFFDKHCIQPIGERSTYLIGNDRIIQLRQACSLNHFSGNHIVPLQNNDPIVFNIMAQCYALNKRIFEISTHCAS